MGNTDLRTFLTSLTLGLCLLVLSFSSMAQSKNSLRFPNFPASIEESIYDGKKGCVGSDPRFWTAVGANEGTKSMGGLKFIETTMHGAHSFILSYHFSKNYGYIMVNKGQKNLCIAEKLTNMSIQEIGNYDATSIEIDGKYTSDQCKFADRFGVLCATFSRMAAGLINNGFTVQFQGVKQNGDVLSYFSNGAKTYELTTDDKSGATVITGSGDSVFEFNENIKR